MAASLKTGGSLILQGYTPKQLEYGTGGPPFLSHLYTADMLRAVHQPDVETNAGLEVLVFALVAGEAAGSGTTTAGLSFRAGYRMTF